MGLTAWFMLPALARTALEAVLALVACGLFMHHLKHARLLRSDEYRLFDDRVERTLGGRSCVVNYADVEQIRCTPQVLPGTDGRSTGQLTIRTGSGETMVCREPWAVTEVAAAVRDGAALEVARKLKRHLEQGETVTMEQGTRQELWLAAAAALGLCVIGALWWFRQIDEEMTEFAASFCVLLMAVLITVKSRKRMPALQFTQQGVQLQGSSEKTPWAQIQSEGRDIEVVLVKDRIHVRYGAPNAVALPLLVRMLGGTHRAHVELPTDRVAEALFRDPAARW
jgi:hypothetical protein